MKNIYTIEESERFMAGVHYIVPASVNYVIINSDNDMSPIRRQTIIWNNVTLLSIAP